MEPFEGGIEITSIARQACSKLLNFSILYSTGVASVIQTTGVRKWVRDRFVLEWLAMGRNCAFRPLGLGS
jgi:hypothetical protein